MGSTRRQGGRTVAGGASLVAERSHARFRIPAPDPKTVTVDPSTDTQQLLLHDQKADFQAAWLAD